MAISPAITAVDNFEEVSHLKVENLNNVLKGTKTKHDDFIVRIAEILGTSRFILGLTLFMLGWLIGNPLVAHVLHHKALDEPPYLLISTCINIYSAYTISILLKADRAQREREEIRNNHEHEINEMEMKFALTTLNEIRALRGDLRNVLKPTVMENTCSTKDCNEA